MVATLAASKECRDIIQWSRHQLQGSKVATSFSGHDISYKELRSRRHSVVATSAASKEGRDIIHWSRHQLQGSKVAASFSGLDISYKEVRSRHQLQGSKVATSFSGRIISCKERRSRHHLAVATLDPRDAKGKSRPNKSFCDIAETIEVATKNRSRDINNQMGQLT